MGTVWLTLAGVTAAVHLALIVVIVVGGPISLRWPRFVGVHAAVAVAVGAVFLVGADCPLTVWQKDFLTRAGEPVYDGGFIEHYLVEPVTGGGMTSVLKVVVLLAWVAPTFVSYGILCWRRAVGTAGSAPA